MPFSPVKRSPRPSVRIDIPRPACSNVLLTGLMNGVKDACAQIARRRAAIARNPWPSGYSYRTIPMSASTVCRARRATPQNHAFGPYAA